jgi:uncharacterized protein YPO0396
MERVSARAEGLAARRIDQEAQRDEVKRAIGENGGDRIEALGGEIERQTRQRDDRSKRADQYAGFAKAAGLEDAKDADAFISNRRRLDSETDAIREQEADVQNTLTEAEIDFRKVKSERDELASEVDSLRRRRSNIPGRTLAVREALCSELNLAETDLPFVGELIEVRPEHIDWEGAAERVLNGFALSLLVPDTAYSRVADWVDRTHIGAKLVYLRVRDRRPAPIQLQPLSLVRKLALKQDSAFYGWLEAELARRFDYVCCVTMEQFRREERALTRTGQIKTSGERHEKDDRHRLDDRTRYVLGWSNQAKISALTKKIDGFEHRLKIVGAQLSQLTIKRRALADRLNTLGKLSVFNDFAELDWRPMAIEIDKLEQERRALQAGSDVLKTLGMKLIEIEQTLQAIATRQQAATADQAKLEERIRVDGDLLKIVSYEAETATAHVQEVVFPRLEGLRAEALGEHKLTVETCDARERELRDWLQTEIDKTDRQIARTRDKVISAMQSYKATYPARDARCRCRDRGQRRISDHAGGPAQRWPSAIRSPIQGAPEREHHPRGGEFSISARPRTRDHPRAHRPNQPVPARHRL